MKTFLSIIFILLFSTFALAVNCGTGIGPCFCGDTVVTNTVLDSNLTCPATALTVAPSVSLDLGLHTITGPGGTTTAPGIILSSGATLLGGTISNYYNGISALDMDGITVQGVTSINHKNLGILIRGNFNRILQSTAGFATRAFRLSGNDNEISDNVGHDTSQMAFSLKGDRMNILRNLAYMSDTDGFHADVNHSLVEGNEGHSNLKGLRTDDCHFNTFRANRFHNNLGTHGLHGDCSDTIFELNLTDANASGGLIIKGPANRFSFNSATSNGGNGVYVTGGTVARPNVDLGGNVGVLNGGIQCQIDGVACLP